MSALTFIVGSSNNTLNTPLAQNSLILLLLLSSQQASPTNNHYQKALGIFGTAQGTFKLKRFN